MKKLLLTLLLTGFMMSGLSAKTAFVYFSTSGNTARMAKKAAKTLKADIYEIQPAQKYTKEDLNWRNQISRATIECSDPASRPEIAGKIDLSSYDTVVLCYPIWWSYAPKIIYTFVEGQDWTGKKLITLSTCGSSGHGKSGTDLAQYAKGADYRGGKDFTRGSGQDIKNYIEKLLK